MRRLHSVRLLKCVFITCAGLAHVLFTFCSIVEVSARRVDGPYEEVENETVRVLPENMSRREQGGRSIVAFGPEEEDTPSVFDDDDDLRLLGRGPDELPSFDEGRERHRSSYDPEGEGVSFHNPGTGAFHDTSASLRYYDDEGRRESGGEGEMERISAGRSHFGGSGVVSVDTIHQYGRSVDESSSSMGGGGISGMGRERKHGESHEEEHGIVSRGPDHAHEIIDPEAHSEPESVHRGDGQPHRGVIEPDELPDDREQPSSGREISGGSPHRMIIPAREHHGGDVSSAHHRVIIEPEHHGVIVPEHHRVVIDPGQHHDHEEHGGEPPREILPGHRISNAGHPHRRMVHPDESGSRVDDEGKEKDLGGDHKKKGSLVPSRKEEPPPPEKPEEQPHHPRKDRNGPHLPMSVLRDVEEIVLDALKIITSTPLFEPSKEDQQQVAGMTQSCEQVLKSLDQVEEAGKIFIAAGDRLYESIKKLYDLEKKTTFTKKEILYAVEQFLKDEISSHNSSGMFLDALDDLVKLIDSSNVRNSLHRVEGAGKAIERALETIKDVTACVESGAQQRFRHLATASSYLIRLFK